MKPFVPDVSVYYQGTLTVYLLHPPSQSCLGYHGDVNATYPVGKIDDESAKLIRTSRECLDKAIELCKPGALFRDLGKTMQVDSD
jgi:methionine aminopeptidase